MKQLIFNADDFGYSRGVNYGIIDSHLHGILTSTTIMSGMPGFDHAVSLAKTYPSLGVGIHLTLTCGYPLLKGHKTLTTDNGAFHKLGFYKDPNTVLDEQEVYLEWKTQIEKVYASGILPTHLDAHHHIHIFKNLEPVFIRLAKEFSLPIRNSKGANAQGEIDGISCPNLLIDFIEDSGVHFDTPLTKYAPAIEINMQRSIKTALKQYDCIEIMCHPAYLDTSVMLHSSFNLHRMCEIDLLTSPNSHSFIEQLSNTTLTNYAIFH